jgi:hypothetical protein
MISNLFLLFGLVWSLDIKADFYAIPIHNLVFSSASPPNDFISVRLGQETLKCHIPPHEPPKLYSNEEQNTSHDVLELALDAVQAMPCLDWNLGYWNYQFCPSKGISQFHSIPEKGVVLQYDLGHSSTKRELVSVNDTHTFTYLSILIGDGTICDVNGEPRSTEIQVYFSYVYHRSTVNQTQKNISLKSLKCQLANM